MKKKHLNIALGMILVIVWGSIIKKYFGKTNPEVNLMASHTSVIDYDYKESNEKDSFQLVLTNTNPFKASPKTRIVKRVDIKDVQPKQLKVIQKEPKNLSWPRISYHGFVQSKDNKTRLALVKVNNRLYRKREQEKINEMLVVKAYEDSLVLSNNNELKTIKKINETL